MAKPRLNLSIDEDLLKIAKNWINPDGSKLNLSGEFEQWLRIRVNSNINDNKITNPDIEIARLKAEIIRIQNQTEMQEKQEMNHKEELMVIDNIIDNEKQYTNLNEISEKRSQGLQFLFKRKFGKNISLLDAKNILENRIKERGLV